jgi:hypothetical protein
MVLNLFVCSLLQLTQGQDTQGQEIVFQFLLHLLPIISPSQSSSTSSSIMEKVKSDLDFVLPFRQHAPSLANARCEIYADHLKWFNGYQDWESFMIDEKDEATKDNRIEDDYYVKKSCYGRSQKERSIKLLEGYWKQRNSWSTLFEQTTTKPTAKEVYYWLTSLDKGVSKFRNIGSLSALLICGDLIEAGLVLMPSSRELGELIFKVGKGARDGMIAIGLVKIGANRVELCKAFESLDLALKSKLTEEEKKIMGYSIIMLEHTLCKIKRLMKGNSLALLVSEIK